ncbi:MAG: hemolysin-coregulated protein [Verrucomicrobiales bacterium]|nr:hemolysin-coregulated protein [Verrucomicrobiales bacterium]
MKTFPGLAAALLCVLAPLTVRATDFAVLLSGVDGGSTDAAFTGGFLIEGFGVDGPLFTGAPAELALSKRIDKASPLLMKGCASGKHFANAVIVGRRSAAGGGTDGSDYIKITLKEVLISGISQGGDDAPLDSETIKLRCSSIFYRYYPVSQTPVPPVFMDLATSGPDTDGDGMPDGWEKHFRLNDKVRDGTLDSDGDGLTNADECRLGFNPLSGDSFFGADVTPTGNGGALDVGWDAIPGKRYIVEWSPNPGVPFQPLAEVTPVGLRGGARVTKVGLTGFFRVRPMGN